MGLMEEVFGWLFLVAFVTGFVALLASAFRKLIKFRHWTLAGRSRLEDINFVKRWELYGNSTESWRCGQCGLKFNFQYLQKRFPPHNGLYLGHKYWNQGDEAPRMCPECRGNDLTPVMEPF